MIMNPASLQMLAANLQASQSSATATNPLAHLLPSSLIGRGASMSALNALQQSNLAHRLATVPTTTPTQIPSAQPTPQTTQLSNGISQNGISVSFFQYKNFKSFSRNNDASYEIKVQVIKSISSPINFKVFLIFWDKDEINPGGSFTTTHVKNLKK